MAKLEEGINALHIWYSPEDSKTKKRQTPVRVDCGGVIGWWHFFRPYIELKVKALNHMKKNDYYVGDYSAVPLSEAK